MYGLAYCNMSTKALYTEVLPSSVSKSVVGINLDPSTFSVPTAYEDVHHGQYDG